MEENFPEKNKKRGIRRHQRIKKLKKRKSLLLKRYGYFLEEFECDKLARQTKRKKHWRYRKYKGNILRLKEFDINTVDILRKECYTN